VRATASKTTNEELLAVLKTYAPKGNSGISATTTPLGNDVSGGPSQTRNDSSDISNSPTIPSINVTHDNNVGPSKAVSRVSGGPSKVVSSDNSGGLSKDVSTDNCSGPSKDVSSD